MNIRKTTAAAAAAIALLALAGCDLDNASKSSWPITTETATAPAPEPPPERDLVERAYLDVLDSEGVYYSSPEAAITAGHAVCGYLDEIAPIVGTDRALIEAGLVAVDKGYSEWHAGTIVGAAVGSWCPEHAPTGGEW